jgi:hypothetical protein
MLTVDTKSWFLINILVDVILQQAVTWDLISGTCLPMQITGSGKYLIKEKLWIGGYHGIGYPGFSYL